MIRARFYIRKDDCDNDYRPVKWPIKYPYWCSAESSNSFVLVAYAEDEDSIKELWPEAYDINVLEKDTESRRILKRILLNTEIIDLTFHHTNKVRNKTWLFSPTAIVG